LKNYTDVHSLNLTNNQSMETIKMISNMLRFPPSLFEGLDEIFAQDFIPRNRRVRAYPQVNMGVTDKSVEVYLFTPGMDASALDVSIEKNLLSVSGERKADEADDKEVLNRRERFVGKFKRTITLPEDVNPDQTEAIYRDGVLHISVAKKEEVQPRQIKITV
jgi:HSP20 family protein